MIFRHERLIEEGERKGSVKETYRNRYVDLPFDPVLALRQCITIKAMAL